jgi:hypothetical protein
MMSLPVLCFRLNNTGLARLGTSHVDLPLSPGRPASADASPSDGGNDKKMAQIMYKPAVTQERHALSGLFSAEASTFLLVDGGNPPTDSLITRRNGKKFPDGTDNIEMGDLPETLIFSGQHVLFSGKFSQQRRYCRSFRSRICLLQSLSKV